MTENSPNDDLPLVITKEYRSTKLKFADTALVRTQKTDSLIKTDFILDMRNDSNLMMLESFSSLLKDSLQFYYFNEPCTLRESKAYHLEGELYYIQKYLYDEENSIDEEALLYVCDRKLIGMVFLAWNGHRLHFYEGSEEITALLQSDSSGFFYF